MTLRESGLLLLGHGSTLNADSSAPTYQHAEELRRRGLFAEVQVGFWKEEPNFRQSLRQMTARRVYVVPNFISSGYFAEQIIPRELGLRGARTLYGNQEVIYTQPVGLHPSMTEALLQGALEAVENSVQRIDHPEVSGCLFICGHGTSFNDNSTKIIYDQAEIIRKRGVFADCQAVLMEQSPFVKDWRTLTACADVIVMPFFISDGLHSDEDIPVLLGISSEKKGANPHVEGRRRLWYGSAIGTGRFMAEVIIAQVEQAQREHPEEVLAKDDSIPAAIPHASEGPASGPWVIGQVAIDRNYRMRHKADAEVPEAKLQAVHSLAELRGWLWFNEAGRFRPLRAAPDLRRGWFYPAESRAGMEAALDYLYPAAWANARLRKENQLPVTSWRETAERQTGRFRVVRELDAAGLESLVQDHCRQGCLKERLWSPAMEAVTPGPGEIPLLCPEACNYLVGKAREKIKGGAEE